MFLPPAGDMPPHGFELPFLRADGESFWVRLYATPLINHLNQQTGWLASMYNITELKKREAIAQAHQRFRTVLNGLDAAVCVSRCEDRQLLFSNRAFEEKHGARQRGRAVLRGAAVAGR